jgi:hypothetical protein
MNSTISDGMGLDRVDDEGVAQHDSDRLRVADAEGADLEGLDALGGGARLSGAGQRHGKEECEGGDDNALHGASGVRQAHAAPSIVEGR